MDNASKNCALPETVDVLVEGCKAKNGTLAELSISYLISSKSFMDFVIL